MKRLVFSSTCAVYGDPDKLRALLDKAGVSQSVKDVLLAETSRDGLARRLDDLVDATINSILAARPS